MIWSTHSETVYALAADARGGVNVGTGPDGSLYFVDPEGRGSWLGKFETGPISALADAEGRLLVLMASPPTLRALGPGLAETGSIESKVFDARIFSIWGRLRWVLDPPAFGVVCGRSTGRRGCWWVGAVTAPRPTGAGESLPAGRSVARGLLPVEKGAGRLLESAAPEAEETSGPRIENLSVLPPGVAYRVQPSGEPGTGPPSRTLPDDVMRYLSGGRRPPSNIRRFYLSGARTVGWDGTDENGDDLSYDVWISGRDEENWRPLARGVTDTFLTWDSRSVEDGWYRIRVVASDGAQNPGEETKTGERITDPFVVDNTPPVLSDLEAKRSGGKATVRFRASDTAGRISYAEYAVDAGEWRVLIPEDRVEDSRAESYRFEIDLPEEPREGRAREERRHVIVVRAAERRQLGDEPSRRSEIEIRVGRRNRQRRHRACRTIPAPRGPFHLAG